MRVIAYDVENLMLRNKREQEEKEEVGGSSGQTRDNRGAQDARGRHRVA
jgi:hypothetical protein